MDKTVAEGKKIYRDVPVGEIFGKWTVVGPGKGKASRLCKCACGTTKCVPVRRLLNGSKTCGCVSSRLIDLTGKRFKKWEVVEIDRTTNRKGSDTFWWCRCDCGNMKSIGGWDLRNNMSGSCGCWHLNLRGTHGKSNTPLWAMHNAAKSRSKKKGIPFDLKFETLKAPEFCPLLGIKLQHHPGLKRGSGGQDDSPSLDQIFPGKGYTEDNTWIISKRANTLKGNASLEELKMLAANLEKKINELNSNFGENERGTFGSGASLDRQQHTVSLSQ